jgi:hypothetical protein
MNKWKKEQRATAKTLKHRSYQPKQLEGGIIQYSDRAYLDEGSGFRNVPKRKADSRFGTVKNPVGAGHGGKTEIKFGKPVKDKAVL